MVRKRWWSSTTLTLPAKTAESSSSEQDQALATMQPEHDARYWSGPLPGSRRAASQVFCAQARMTAPHGKELRCPRELVALWMAFGVALPHPARGACGSTAAGWNAPAGAAVFSRGSGPVRDVIDALGESRSHSMLSHGPGGYVSQATMATPARSSYTGPFSGFCYHPLDTAELRDGYPGGSQVNQGAIYTFLYEGGDTEYVYYQNGDSDGANRGNDVQSYLWWSVPVAATAARESPDQSLWLIYNSTGTARTNYSLYQFRNIESVHLGKDGWNNGFVCSTLLAWAQARADVNQQSALTYSHDVIARAAHKLRDSVFEECKTSIGFWGGVGASVSCPFTDVCDRAANQVVNCMAAGKCDESHDGAWSDIVGDATSVAVSISPDCVGGWNACPAQGPGASVWAYDGNNLVQWNADGNQYGCWE